MHFYLSSFTDHTYWKFEIKLRKILFRRAENCKKKKKNFITKKFQENKENKLRNLLRNSLIHKPLWYFNGCHSLIFLKIKDKNLIIFDRYNKQKNENGVTFLRKKNSL